MLQQNITHFLCYDMYMHIYIVCIWVLMSTCPEFYNKFHHVFNFKCYRPTSKGCWASWKFYMRFIICNTLRLVIGHQPTHCPCSWIILCEFKSRSSQIVSSLCLFSNPLNNIESCQKGITVPTCRTSQDSYTGSLNNPCTLVVLWESCCEGIFFFLL